ncbi:LPS-assembly protein LptD [Chitinimonas sp.]|uniref:LPS-assembly protein LptD n=1 Tax=Chitinimonas sp. TaxID=1934313 RepID=UPI0035AE31C0
MPRYRLLPVCIALFSAFASADSPPAPTVIDADHVDGTSDTETFARGNVLLKRNGQTIEADWVKLLQTTHEVMAGDRTRIRQNGDVLEGGQLHLYDDTRIGTLDQPTFSFAPRLNQPNDWSGAPPRDQRRGGHGDAAKLLFEGPDKYRLEQARFTSCKPGQEDWFIKSPDLSIDYTRNLGVARNSTLEFKGVPMFYSPYLDFSLDGSRKSGFLAPTWGGTTGAGGFDLTVPWYWNIAPNMDATIAPRIMSKRGVLFDTEFRYLGSSYQGTIKAEEIFRDASTGHERHAYQWQHLQALAPGLIGSIDYRAASDDQYFTDFGDRVAIASTTYLPREALLRYGVPGFMVQARVQRFQTLQRDPVKVVPTPYERRPQITVNYNPLLSPFYRLDLNAEAVDFHHPTLVEGKRLTLTPSISMPIETGYGFINPKLAVHASQYSLSQNKQAALADSKLSRTLPMFSLDAGLYFDRDVHMLGQDMVQSLEPRIYYLRVPFKDQSAFPNFDTGLADFSFAQLFSENRFTGGDRIGDANELTTAVSSRLFETDTGIERARLSIGQRFYFDPQRVTASGQSNTGGVSSSDLIASAAGQLREHWWLDTTWQYDTRQKRAVKEAVNLRYQTSPTSLLNLRYRLDRQNSIRQDNIKQFDISAQWPISGAWHGIARHNWSIADRRALETLAGVEYNGGCWVFRAVAQRFVTTSDKYSNAYFIQLELNDLGRLGSNPLQVLKDSIPGYTKLN